jgi:putative membrane protein
MTESADKPDSTELAFQRTWLALERTLMAQVRTATSMISFGFTVYKFFQFESKEQLIRRGILSPRDFALVMVSIGLVSLFLGFVQHRERVKELNQYIRNPSKSIAAIEASFVAVFGILVLISAIVRA